MAPADLQKGGVEALHGVAALLGRTDEGVRHGETVALLAGASRDNRDFHGVLFLNGIGILVVGLGHAAPGAVDLHQQQVVREVDASAPVLLQHAHDGERLLDIQHVDAGPEAGVGSHAVHVAVELFDAAVFEFAVQVAEQHGLVDEQLPGVAALPLGHAPDELAGRLFHGPVLFDACSHGCKVLVFRGQNYDPGSVGASTEK